MAAERLHLSVSSLSKRIAELETSLGAALFDRQHYRAALTPAGMALLPRARALLDEAEDLRRLLRQDTGVCGRLRLGVGELASQTWLPKLMALAAERHPQLVLEPVVDTGEQMELRLESGEFDCAVAAGCSARAGVLSYPMGRADFVWVAAPHLPRLAVQDALSRWPLVTLPQGAGTHHMLEDWLLSHGYVVHRRLTCNTWGAVAGLLAEGIGIGFLPQGWATPLLARGGVLAREDWPALSSLRYALRVRQGDERAVLTTLRALLAQTVDFAEPIRFLALPGPWPAGEAGQRQDGFCP